MNIIFKILNYLKNYRNIIGCVLALLLVIMCIVQTIRVGNYKSSYEEELKSGSTVQAELDSIKLENKDLKSQIFDYEYYIADKDKQIQQLEEQVQKLEDTSAKLAASKTSTFKADGNYNQARTVWNYLRDLGLNEYVCAGILGNIMAEVGGQTLDISRWSYYSSNSSTYYGICQWAGGRKSRLLNNFGTSLEAQLEFLSVELFEVIPKGNAFYSMQNEQEAALYFAKYYERCSSKYYSVRQRNATKALSYFRSV